MKATNFLIPLLLLLLFTACDDGFEELNANPNEPELVPPSTLFPLAVREAVDRIHGHRTRNERLNLDGGMLWMQYFARNQYVNEGDTYNPAATLRNETWDGFYTESLVNLQTVINLTAAPDGRYYNPNYAAAATVMREYVFSILTDTWGAIPYSAALAGSTEGNLAPVYDSQEAVYAGMLANLKAASEQLDPSGRPIDKDILFNSDIVLWKKFANSLRLRLANRMADRAPGESRAVFAEILGDPARYPIITSNYDAAFFRPTARQNDENNNSWHEVMVFDSREDWSISTTLINAMADAEGNATDPRLEVYAKPAQAGDRAGKYAGAPNGLPEGDAVAYFTTASRPGEYFTAETQAVPLITYAEINFILAEAAMDGEYTAGPGAVEYLEAGVRASFEQYGLTMPDNYVAGRGISRETLMTEKWKALFPQGIEAWTEYRRTGFPVLPDPDPRAVMENEGKVPTRLRYPESEYSLNNANVAAGVAMNGGPDTKLTPLWWAE
ncbi:SusD/RagB family nutrient-binding outer membrane lipoprotein [Neolewinella litorea]|uniref:SusD/RagB family nutrient-binding outer membrane lipoprotein n=1 Tax=Neolewinella litorea TaxID=2562452 RepID=A0A4S4NLV0_9BACT|nr:SusD/RagB family nutrient-binding outer membrane lipoprotein [Neolewinella litorea]THH39308.1 SusD/RagB family nutrient-binding outer membrane lipoprotein [Neolewinella litorea]